MTTRAQRPWGRWLLWGLLLVATGIGMRVAGDRLDKAHHALAFLLVVLGGSAAGGRALGITLAVSAFVGFNYFFLAPVHSITVADPRDWIVLVAFLVTGIVAAQLLYRAKAEALVANARRDEIDRLATLGAETLSAGRAEEALEAILRVVRTTLGVATCEVWLREPETGGLAPMQGASSAPFGPDAAVARPPSAFTLAPSSLLHWVSEQGQACAELDDGTIRTTSASSAEGLSPTLLLGPNVVALSVPLTVRGRTVGVLRVADPRSIALDQQRSRFLDALAYYAALGVERVRLSAAAERAEALREADRLKDGLLASVSHDIRTPLTTIRALAHAIAGEGDERALVIEEEVERINRFVANLLDLSRLRGGAVPLDLAVVAAEDLMGAVLQRVSGMAEGREIQAALDPREPFLVGRFDFTHSLRILANLLENALKYTPPSTPIEFTVRREGAMLAFRVADRGPGVPEEQRERIFTPFYRDLPSRADSTGAGLGLAIARGLAESQGGSLAYAPREGGGSVFTLWLPAAELTGEGAIPPDESGAPAGR